MIGTISIEDVVKGVVVNGDNVVDYDGIAKIIIPAPPEVPVKDVKVDGESVVDPQGDANIVIPVKDVKVDGESVIDSEGIANITIPDPPEAPVKDVKVDGESVVNAQGVANITLPDPPEVPVKDVKVNGESVVNAQGVANVVVPVISNLRVVKQLPGVPAAVVTVSDAEAFTMPSLTVGVEPVQDLHGYDAPWVGGAGKNKFYIDLPHEEVSGSATYLYELTLKPNTAYTMSSNVPQDNPASLYFNGGATNVNGVWSGISRTFTSDENGKLTAFVRFSASQGGIDLYTAVKNGQYYIQLEEGSTATLYAPYSNICPISGWSEANVTVADDVETPTVSNVYTIDLDGTRYGGYIEIVNGVTRFVATKGYIASYNGETLPSDWISDRDVYSEGTTPTIGAEVVYTLATPTIIPLGNYPISTLAGVNNIFADSGNVLQGEYASNIKVVDIG